MHILAIDTASSSLGAAVANENGVVGEFSLNIGKQHSVTLLSLVEQLLALSNLQLTDMSALAVTVGPGSFTGLRIGLATVKGWAQALDLPVVPVSTLEALAFSAIEKDVLVCPILDARRDEVYAALFANGERLMADTAIAPIKLAEQLLDFDLPILFAGDGIAAHGTKIAAILGEQMLIAPPVRGSFFASAAAILARERFLAGQIESAETLVPQYLRLSEPEERKLANRGQI